MLEDQKRDVQFCLSFVTLLSESGADTRKSMRPLNASQALRAHEELQRKIHCIHCTTTNSTAGFFTILFDSHRSDFRTTKNWCLSRSSTPRGFGNTREISSLTQSHGTLYDLSRLRTALKRFITYTTNTTGQAQLSLWASMAIEKDFLMELKRTDNLFDRVIELFWRKEKGMDLMYK